MIGVYDSHNHRNFCVWDVVRALGDEACSALSVWDLVSTDDCDVQVSDCDDMVQVCDNNASGNMTCRNNRPLYKLHNC